MNTNPEVTATSHAEPWSLAKVVCQAVCLYEQLRKEANDFDSDENDPEAEAVDEQAVQFWTSHRDTALRALRGSADMVITQEDVNQFVHNWTMSDAAE